MLRKPVAFLTKLLGAPTPKPDRRGRRLVALIECVLNQNARDAGAACSPALNFDCVQQCHQHEVGILQMPCPEIAALGPARKRAPGVGLREALESEYGRSRCQALAIETVDRIEAHISQGCALLAVVGGNPRSPGCAIHPGPDGLRSTSGVFMKALQAELRQRNHEVIFQPMRDHDPQQLQEDLAQFRDLLVAADKRTSR